MEGNAPREASGQEPDFRILLVEDDSSLHDAWDVLVRSLPFRCVLLRATSLRAAEHLLAAARQPFDLIISDVFLAGDATGIDLWKRHGHEAANFLFTSSVTEQSFARLMRSENKSFSFMAKPLDLRKCAYTLACWAHRREGLPHG